MNNVIYQNPVIAEMKVKSANNRRIYLNGTVDDDMAMEVSYYFNKIISNDNGKKENIYLLFNSYGGSVIAGNAIIGNIKYAQSLGYKIIGIVESMAYSMAYDILIHCDERIGMPLSQYLLHQTSFSQGGELKEFEREVDFQKKQWKVSEDYYVANTNIPRERIQEVYERKENWFFMADEALQNGTIHKIIG